MDLSLSVIIPTLNEESQIAATISAAREVGCREIIVVDGGSRDATVSRAQAADRVLNSQPGRGTQQNCGASVATGEILLFLHADCQLSPGYARDILRLMAAHPQIAAGCFRQQIDSPQRIYRCLEWGNLQRVLWFQMAYGDQGIFIRKAIFDEIGQFPNWPLMEDVGLMQRLRGRYRFAVLNTPLTVSPRRWERQGVFGQTLRNWLLLTLFAWGVSPDYLAKLYTLIR